MISFQINRFIPRLTEICCITLVLLALSFPLFGQTGNSRNSCTLSGQVVDSETGKPLEFTAISVLSSSDSTLVAGGISDQDGRYSLRVAPGEYLARFEFISYEQLVLDDIVISPGQRTLDMGTVPLELSARTLEEVVVTGERSQFELGLDKRVFNVEKDLLSRSGSAADILDNIPSVQVDLDGTVSLRGSSNVRILIDGRPSGLVGLSGNDALRTLQADLVERVEVITNPSARYDAEGMAGIINIVLKKDRRKGVNGTFSVNTGYPANHGASAGINVRKRDVNFFANAGVRYRKGPGGGSLYQEYYRGDSTTYLEQTSDRVRGGWSYNARVGMDYYITDHTFITGSFMYRNGDEENRSDVGYRDFDPEYNLVSISQREELETEKEPNFEYVLNFSHQFGGNDKHTLKAAAQYEDSEETEDADYLERSFNPDGTPTEIPDLVQHRLNIEKQTQWLAQIDYVRPVGEKGNFEAGYKFNSRDINNDFKVEELIGDEWETIKGLSNNFLYEEAIQAAYLIYGNEWKRFDYQAGIRTEHSDIKTYLIETNEANQKKYIDFFPSVHIGYSFASENTLQLSYSRRIRRPHFHWLNPFSSFSDNRNIWTGNPDLDPEYTTSLELGHIKYWNKASISSSIYFRHTTNVIQRIRTIDDEGITITTPYNLASRDEVGIEFTFSRDISDAWRIDGNANFFHQALRDGTYGDADNYSLMARINSRVMLFKTVETQLRLNYRGPRETPQGRSKSMTYLDFGASMDVLKGSGTITLSVNDLFNTRKYRYITEGEGFYSEGSFRWRARTTTLTFSYRLNQKKNRREGPGRNGEGFDGGDMDFGN